MKTKTELWPLPFFRGRQAKLGNHDNMSMESFVFKKRLSLHCCRLIAINFIPLSTQCMFFILLSMPQQFTPHIYSPGFSGPCKKEEGLGDVEILSIGCVV
jgi:hypothetical protein